LALPRKDAKMLLMAKRQRMYFDTDDELKTMLELEALKRGISVTKLIQESLSALFPESRREAKKILENRPKPKK
jgi:hypothetical protein